jgi:hypothetical protein
MRPCLHARITPPSSDQDPCSKPKLHDRYEYGF